MGQNKQTTGQNRASSKRAEVCSKSSKVDLPGSPPTDSALVVGAFLRGMRKAQRLSQAQVSSLTGSHPWKVSRPVISSIERGEHLPSFESLMALSKVLHFDPMEVLERAENAVGVPVDITGYSLEDLIVHARDLALAGSYREALAVYDATLERLVLDPPSDAASALRWQADIELKRAGALGRCGALLSAEAAAKRSVSLAVDEPEIQSFAYAILAKLQIQRGFLPLARDHAQRAVEIAESCGAAPRGRALLELGEVVYVSEEFERATEVFVEARDLLREGGDHGHASHVEGNIGLCWAARGETERARNWFRRALELSRKQVLPILEARWLTELGKLTLSTGTGKARRAEADRYALAALAIARPRDHWMSIFRAEWLRHGVVAAEFGKKNARERDRSRLARLRKLMVHLADHTGESEISEYESLIGGDSVSGKKRRRR